MNCHHFLFLTSCSYYCSFWRRHIYAVTAHAQAPSRGTGALCTRLLANSGSILMVVFLRRFTFLVWTRSTPKQSSGVVWSVLEGAGWSHGGHSRAASQAPPHALRYDASMLSRTSGPSLRSQYLSIKSAIHFNLPRCLRFKAWVRYGVDALYLHDLAIGCLRWHR